jgi:hypothetical protein
VSTEDERKAWRSFCASNLDNFRIPGFRILGARRIVCAFNHHFASRFRCFFMVPDKPGSILIEWVSPCLPAEGWRSRNAIFEISVIRVDQW